MKKYLLLFSIFHFSLFTLNAQGTWTQRASLPDSARECGIGFSVNNYGYVGLGGYFTKPPYHYYFDFWQYDSVSNSWVQKANFPGNGIICPATFVIGHKAFVITGQDSTIHYVSECWEYDADADKWTRKNNFPGTARAYDVGFTIGNNGFIGTGYDGSKFNDFWEYDTTSDIWTQKANFGGTARFAASGFAVGSKGYICFGEDATKMNQDIWEYDTTANTWTQKASYPDIGIYAASGFAIGSSIFVGMGTDGYNHRLTRFWRYNTLTDTWTQKTNFPHTALIDPSTFTIGNRGYLGLGSDSISNEFNEFYEFAPDTITGIDELTSNNEGIRIFPNPSNGYFKIEISNSELVIKGIDIYNTLGEKIYSHSFSSVNFPLSIDLTNQPSSVYILKLNLINQILYQKIIINN